MKVKVAIMNAFVDGKTGGNPAGVVLEADLLSAQQKLAIAKQVGLSETAFVSSSNVADFKLDFFTPEKQIAHCGHATIATFSYLSQLGLIASAETSKETIDGIRRIQIKGEKAYMEQLAPKYTILDRDIDKYARAIGLSSQALTSVPMVVNTGNSFLILGVKDIAQLESVQAEQSLINEISEELDLIGFYVFTLQTNKAGRDASTRMFAPRYGIAEESATGMAAGPLACYLHNYLKIDKTSFVIEQGYAMKPASPSCIEVNLNFGTGGIQSLSAGGVGMASKYVEVEI
jgi:PhzF family phenazine biosynthesis protein